MLKRTFDLLLAVILAIVLFPIYFGIFIYACIVWEFPIFYISERMKTPKQSFDLIKFRTMKNIQGGNDNTGVSGGDKNDRITRLGHILRSKRLDEIPQIINVLKDDMSFVGPRPPLRQYTDQFSELYEQVLQDKPGITGLASIIYSRHEARLISRSKSADETNEIYTRRCIPRKAKLDNIYAQNKSLCLDMYILYLTAAKFAPLPGRRARRIAGRELTAGLLNT